MSKKLVLFASGNGSNVENIAVFFNQNPSFRVETKLIITNNPNAKVIERAKKLCIPIEVILFDTDGYEKKMLDKVNNINPDLIVLAGFLKKIPDTLLKEYDDKMINIHPSLLPKHGGAGMYGDKVHKSVTDAREKESGITIHWVNSEYDKGKIIKQYKVNVEEDDSVETLANKIHALEYEYYPKVIAEILA